MTAVDQRQKPKAIQGDGIELVPATPETFYAAAKSPEALAAALRVRVSADWDCSENPEDQQRWAMMLEHHPNSIGHVYWYIVRHDLREAVGIVTLGWSFPMGTVEIGYQVSSRHRNRGYATLAVAALIDWIREQPDLHTVEIGTHSSNAASKRVIEKNGLHYHRHVEGRGDYYRLVLHPDRAEASKPVLMYAAGKPGFTAKFLHLFDDGPCTATGISLISGVALGTSAGFTALAPMLWLIFGTIVPMGYAIYVLAGGTSDRYPTEAKFWLCPDRIYSVQDHGRIAVRLEVLASITLVPTGLLLHAKTGQEMFISWRNPSQEDIEAFSAVCKGNGVPFEVRSGRP